MHRLPGQQAPKALYSLLHHSFRNSLRHPLRIPPHTHHVYTDQAPFSGPPTYETITRRFSPPSNPVRYFAEKKSREAIERGEWIDIHDIGPVSPRDFDVLITDMNHDKLRTEVSELIGIPYLQQATKDEANKIATIGDGLIYGDKFRNIFPCVVSYKSNERWIFFIVDIGAPVTYLSSQALNALDISDTPRIAKIAGYPHPIHLSPEASHFAELNILGSDFVREQDVCLWPKGRERKLKLIFNVNDNWEEPKPKL